VNANKTRITPKALAVGFWKSQEKLPALLDTPNGFDMIQANEGFDVGSWFGDSILECMVAVA